MYVPLSSSPLYPLQVLRANKGTTLMNFQYIYNFYFMVLFIYFIILHFFFFFSCDLCDIDVRFFLIFFFFIYLSVYFLMQGRTGRETLKWLKIC